MLVATTKVELAALADALEAACTVFALVSDVWRAVWLVVALINAVLAVPSAAVAATATVLTDVAAEFKELAAENPVTIGVPTAVCKLLSAVVADVAALVVAVDPAVAVLKAVELLALVKATATGL